MVIKITIKTTSYVVIEMVEGAWPEADRVSMAAG
jgi:hypothetical protein